MRYNKCCVPGCNTRRQDAVMLHKFPTCENRRNKWLDSINCASLRVLSVVELGKQCVCHKHFEARFLTQKSRLLMQAYPTLFTEHETSTGVPTHSNSENQNTSSEFEHNYCRTLHVDHNYAASRPTESPLLRAPLANVNINVMQPALSYSSAMEIDPVPSTSKALYTEFCNTQEPFSSKDVSLEPKSATASVTDLGQPTPKKKRRFDTKYLTPTCKELYMEYRKSRKLLSFHRRAKKAQKFSKEQTFQKLTAKMNPAAKSILLMQIKQCTKNKKGRRFTQEEKIVSLAIQKQSPKAYKFLQKIFILPSETTLKKMLAKFVIGPGINSQIFSSIKEEVSNWKEEKKYCSILFDEMALDTAITYLQKDFINGFIDLTERTNDFADHVLCFMIKGAIYKWQQAIAYYFCEGATKAIELKTILKIIVEAVGETGLIPIVLISDQGTAFQSALKSLQQDTRRDQILAEENIDDTIHIGSYQLNIIFDPPHLIKGIRNNFLTKNIQLDGTIARWSDIVDVYKMDCLHAESRLLHKLTDEHVIPEKIKKMKVRNCAQVFSHTMASALKYTTSFSHYIDGKPVSNTMSNTSQVVTFLDNLFDSVNGASTFSKKSKGKELRSTVTKTSLHHTFWREAIEKFQQMKFIDKKSKEVTVPSIRNWLVTLRSFQRLWQFFEEKNIKIMRPRYFNSDGLENFFGRVRAYNSRNNNPDCHSFTNTFKSLLITGFIKFHYNSFNCEDESCYQFLKMQSLFERNVNISEILDSDTDLESNSPNNDSVNLCTMARRERLNIHARAYTAGWVIRKILKKSNCRQCKKDLTSNESDVHRWVSQKEYKNNKRGLIYASEHFVMLFGTIFKETNLFLDSNAHKHNLATKIHNIIRNKCAFEFISCQKHKNDIIQAFISVTTKLAIHNWCNIINKILKGTDIVRLENSSSKPVMQAKALRKFKKKLKKNPNK